LWARYFAVGQAELNEIMITVIICKEMGWTWEEYQNQPAHFIDTIIKMLKARAEAEKNKQ